MSEGPTAAGAARRVGSGTTRLVRAWKALPNESRLAAYASGALFLTLFLPWYQVTLIAPAKAEKLQSASATITGWGAFSFVEAAVLIVAVAVLTLLFQRAEGRAFHLPGGDGGVILAAGLWTCLLIVWRIFDKQGATTNGPSATTSGIEWGIFVALAAAAFLAYAGSRIRAAHRPEPPLPGEDTAPVGSSAAATGSPGGDASTSAGGDASTSAGGASTSAGGGTAATAREAEAATASASKAAPRGPVPAAAGTRRPVPPRRRPRTAPPVPDDRPARDRSAHASPERSANARPDRSANARPDRSAHASPDRSADAGRASEPAPQPAPDGPRRRPSAAELFEHVVPDDPPTMPFGRAKPADADAMLRMASTPPPDEPADQPSEGRADPRSEGRAGPRSEGRADPTPPDEQLTMPLGNDDDTLPLDRDR